MTTRREFLSGLAVAGVAMQPMFREHAIRSLFRANAIAGDRSPIAVADDETYWAEIQRAFDSDRTMINLNNGGCSPTPSHVLEAMIRDLRFSNELPMEHMWRVLEPRVPPVGAVAVVTLDGHHLARPVQPLEVPARLDVPHGHLQAEGRRLGVHAVGAADLQRLAVLLGPGRDDGERAVESVEDQRARLAHLQRERRIHDVGGREAVMEPAALLAELLGRLPGAVGRESHQQVADVQGAVEDVDLGEKVLALPRRKFAEHLEGVCQLLVAGRLRRRQHPLVVLGHDPHEPGRRGVPVGQQRGRATEMWHFSHEVNFAKVAEAMGCVGIRVERPEDIRPALEKALASRCPAVVEVISEVDAMSTRAWRP